MHLSGWHTPETTLELVLLFGAQKKIFHPQGDEKARIWWRFGERERGKVSSYRKETYLRHWNISFGEPARTRVRPSSLCARKEGKEEEEGQTLPALLFLLYLTSSWLVWRMKTSPWFSKVDNRKVSRQEGQGDQAAYHVPLGFTSLGCSSLSHHCCCHHTGLLRNSSLPLVGRMKVGKSNVNAY